jgi:hypothetical protein
MVCNQPGRKREVVNQSDDYLSRYYEMNKLSTTENTLLNGSDSWGKKNKNYSTFQQAETEF